MLQSQVSVTLIVVRLYHSPQFVFTFPSARMVAMCTSTLV